MDAYWQHFSDAHQQPFDCNAVVHPVEDRALYDAAHRPAAAPPAGKNSVGDAAAGHAASNVTMSPAGTDAAGKVTAAADAHVNVAKAPSGEDAAAYRPEEWQALEAVAPGFALAFFKEQKKTEEQIRRYRIYRLLATMCIAVTAIACGQWALVHGAENQALYLSGAGLISLVTTLLQHE